MSEDINSIRTQLWEKMRSKSYRDTFVAAHLSTNIAAQIQTIREARGWKQRDLAEKTGMSPARISIMENPSYDKYTISTLKRVASTFDVSLIVRFAPFSELVDWVADLSPAKLSVSAFEKDSLKQLAVPESAPEPAIQQEPITMEVSALSLIKRPAQGASTSGQLQALRGPALGRGHSERVQRQDDSYQPMAAE